MVWPVSGVFPEAPLLAPESPSSELPSDGTSYGPSPPPAVCVPVVPFPDSWVADVLKADEFVSASDSLPLSVPVPTHAVSARVPQATTRTVMNRREPTTNGLGTVKAATLLCRMILSPLPCSKDAIARRLAVSSISHKQAPGGFRIGAARSAPSNSARVSGHLRTPGRNATDTMRTGRLAAPLTIKEVSQDCGGKSGRQADRDTDEIGCRPEAAKGRCANWCAHAIHAQRRSGRGRRNAERRSSACASN